MESPNTVRGRGYARAVIKALRDFGSGTGLLLRGFQLLFSAPKRVLVGMLPALITAALMLAGVITLGYQIDELSRWATGFASDWSDGLRTAMQVAVGVSIVAVALGLSVILFTAVSLIIGGPFYEYIAEEVEDELGGVPDGEKAGWWKCFVIGIRDAILLVGLSLLCAIPLFFAGFIPIVGQTVVPVVAVCVNGYLLATELTAIPFTRRGRGLKERRRALATRRAVVLGFAVPTYLLCLVPLAALIVIPAAMAGGTVLSHRLLTSRSPVN
jgi:CysZ protein